MKKITLLLFFFLPLLAHAQVIVTAAGDDTEGYCCDGHPATAAELDLPFAVALDNNGNLYICDLYNDRIRKVSPAYGGIITTIAGTGSIGYSGDGWLGIHAQIFAPADITTDRYGNVYFVDGGNNCIRKITPGDTITTIAGTGTAGYNGDGIPATAAQLNNADEVTIDKTGNIYIADASNHRIRMVDTTGIIHTIAGTGIDGFSPDGSLADTAKLSILWGLRVGSSGNIYYADSSRVRKIDTAGIISTIAGNGIEGFSGDSGLAVDAEIGGEGGIGIDANENVYIADGDYNRVREVSNPEGVINTIAGDGDGAGGFGGDGGPPLLAKISTPVGVFVDDSDNIYIADEGNQRIRLITKHPLAVNNITANEELMDMYPNPCHNRCTIQIHSFINEQADVVISNVTGEILYHFSAVTNEPFTFRFTWPPGVYIIHATTAQQQFNEKLVVQ